MKTILIAEDHSANRELIRELLESRGYTVIEACNGKDALERLISSKPDLVLTDIHMPVLSGVEVVRAIRNDKALCALPIVALTAFAMDGDRQKGLLNGFDGYVTKPIDISSLISEIERCLKLHKQDST